VFARTGEGATTAFVMGLNSGLTQALRDGTTDKSWIPVDAVRLGLATSTPTVTHTHKHQNLCGHIHRHRDGNADPHLHADARARGRDDDDRLLVRRPVPRLAPLAGRTVA
jgi:hypothetical protein